MQGSEKRNKISNNKNGLKGGLLLSNFNAKNNLNTKKLFFERLKYASQALTEGGPKGTFKNFSFSERVMYGRIKKDHKAISLNPSYLKNIKSRNKPKKQLRAINFVADAFEKVVLEFEKAAISGKLDDTDPYLYKVTAHRAFVDPVKSYRTYNNRLINLFTNKFLSKKRKEQIYNFSSFLDFFNTFILQSSKTLPITYTSFITSNFCGPLNSGLAIHIADLDASNDSQKEQFINSKNFKFYKIIAEKHGFSINKNVPWVLIADIASPPMLRYASLYGFSSDNSILDGCYFLAHTKDIENLQSLTLRAYNNLIRLEPKNIKINDFGIRHSVCRVPISAEQVLEEYPNKNWVDIYIDIRYIEQRNPGSLANLSTIKRNAKAIQAAQGTLQMQEYVNNSIFGFDNFNGSYSKNFSKKFLNDTGIQTKPTY